MKINKNNYEPWLTLYLDNELTAEEKNEVEKFLFDHPEFRSELEALYMTLQVPELPLSFPDKDILYKKPGTETSITPQNRQEFFTLYHDNELSKEERMQVERFVGAHPAFKEEFMAAGSLRMVPDTTTTFAAINTLYRPKRIYRPLLMNRWSMAAAASILIILSLQAIRFFYFNSPGKEQSVTITKPNSNSRVTLKNTANESLISAEQSTRNRNVQGNLNSNAFTRKENIVSKIISAASTSIEVQAPQLAVANENTSVSHVADIAIALPEADMNASLPKASASFVRQAEVIQPENNPIISTSYAEKLDIPWEEEENEENSVIQRNTGIKVFIRKINRAMERIAVRESEKEKHKNMVRIASLKIGME
jgi:hypothetical protein